MSLNSKLSSNGIISVVWGLAKTSYKTIDRVGRAYSVDAAEMDVKVEEISEDWFAVETKKVSDLYIQLELAKLGDKPKRVKHLKKELAKAKLKCGVVNTRIANKKKAIKKAKKDMKSFEKLMLKSIKNS